MGYDISAYGTDKYPIASMEAPANVFEKLKSNGYDWFMSIDAPECDGIVSGLGDKKKIKLTQLKKALNELMDLDRNNAFKENIRGPYVDPMGIGKIMEKAVQEHAKINFLDRIYLKHQMIEGQNRVARYIIDDLKEFMGSCIDWCKENNRNEVTMFFS